MESEPNVKLIDFQFKAQIMHVFIISSEKKNYLRIKGYPLPTFVFDLAGMDCGYNCLSMEKVI